MNARQKELMIAVLNRASIVYDESDIEYFYNTSLDFSFDEWLEEDFDEIGEEALELFPQAQKAFNYMNTPLHKALK